MIIQIIGQAGAGKTALAEELAQRVHGIHINADKVRAELNNDLGFSEEDRIENARRLGALARLISEQGHIVIVDFICPTEKTREAFGSCSKRIWVNRVDRGRFEDTNKMWEDPREFDLEFRFGLTIEEEVEAVISAFDLFDWRKPTTLMLGRYQPWHEGHQQLWEKARERTEQVLIGVRDTYQTSEKDPFNYQEVVGQILHWIPRPFSLSLPNITNIVYGRDVGYKIEQIKLDEATEAISATQKRKEMGIA